MFTPSLRIGATLAAVCLVIASVLATSADAQRQRGGHGGGHAAPARHSAPAARSAPSFHRSAPSIHRAAPSFRRSAPSHHRIATPRNLRRSPAHASRQRGGNKVIRRGSINSKQRNVQRNVLRQHGKESPKQSPTITRRTPGDRSFAKQSAPARIGDRNAAIRHSVLRNRAFTGQSGRRSGARAFARTNFRGQFAGKHFANPNWADFHRHRHDHIFVVGWIGPVFWPYAYDDFIDYTFYPYGYDTFWPYAYDDVYVSLFGPYAYVGNTYANAPAYRARGRVQRVPQGGVAQVCSTAASGLTNWPVEQIAEAVEPDEAQQGLLTNLRNATASAVESMQSACPTELPGTPTARLAAMRTRLEAMLKAVTIVRPALERFYDSLSDEQKARFNALPEDGQTARRTARTPERSLACGADVTAPVPIDRIRRVVEPSEAQASALEALDQATRKAAEDLKASCQGDQNLTPPGRIAAMEQRLKATLEALDVVQPALDRFYGSLSDEQKARFNRLPRQG